MGLQEGTFIVHWPPYRGASTRAFFIDRTLEEKAMKVTGRWLTCQPRGGIFGRRT